MSKEQQLKDLNLEDLAKLLRDSENEDNADEILKDFIKEYDVNEDDLEEILATDWNCIKCSCCGRFFGEDEMSAQIEDECIFCVEDEMFYEQND